MVHCIERGESMLKGSLICPYQPTGVRFMVLKEITGPGCILADDMGLGKTVMTITFIMAMREANHAPTLVVAPKSVCQQWKDEIEKFCDLRCCVYDRKMDELKDISDANMDIIIVSYPFFSRDACVSSLLLRTKFYRVILDEAHLIKNPNTVTSRHIRLLDSEKRLCLSGTPIQNDAKDLFSLVKWIHREDCGAEWKLNMSSRSLQTRMRCTEFIRKNMLLRRTLDDVCEFNPTLALPGLSVQVLAIPFGTAEESALYAHVESMAEEKIRTVLKQYHTQGNMDILEALLRCRQVCIHPDLFIDSVRENPRVGNKWKIPLAMRETPYYGTKLQTLVKMISMHPLGDKTLIFSAFVKEMMLIRRMLRGIGIESLLYYGDMTNPEREAVLERFRDPTGNSVVLIIQMQAGGTGLNLQVANKCYVTSPAYNPTLEMQCIARSHRTGQLKRVTCVRLVMQDTVEERILDIQKKKMNMISLALDDERLSDKLDRDRVSLSKDDILDIFRIDDIDGSRSIENDEPPASASTSTSPTPCYASKPPPIKKSRKIQIDAYKPIVKKPPIDIDAFDDLAS
jgi:non-specific serine/threonine protein kinase